MSKSALEDAFALQLRVTGLDAGVTREHRFHPKRRWRFDFAWPARRVAVEVEGGIWAHGRHTRGSGYLGDLEKYNEAVLLGWVVLRVAREHIEDGRALRWLELALRAKE